MPLTSLGQNSFIPAFELEPNDIELTRLARPSTYFDKVGRKFAILGFESGTFESWAYPLKLLRNFEFSFFIGSSTEPIKGKDIVRYISVTPEATTLTFTYQSFTVRAIYVTPIQEPGAIIFLDVNTTEPLTMVCSFIPVLQPMWPAGLGGQYAYWDKDLKAYLISESSKKNHAYVGSPAASGISYTPAHMLSDTPNQFKIEIKEIKSVQGQYIPVILAGGKGKREEVKKVYQKLLENPEKFYHENVTYYKYLRQSTLQVETPNQELNLAFEWAKVAYDNLVVENPDLGKGLVAGLGTSGTGGRPGFGWFFGGDAFINSFSLNSYGAFSTVRQTLAFTQKWQREDGKMAHELSQAAGYINWFQNYPFGYIHGDTTPYYLVAMYDYYKMTGDVEFIKNSWNSLKQAYEWCLSTDENGDGLMDNKKAGLGALEFGTLTDIQTDIYLAAVWVRATYAMEPLALAVGDKSYAQKAKTQFQKSLKAYNEKFWDHEYQHYAYAFNAKGEQVKEVTPWSAVGLMWELGAPQRSARTLEKLNSAELSTDWGIRSISIKSHLFEPLNYNYGAVWPFLTSWVATAQYKHHFALQGYNSLMSSVRHTFDNALGSVTEVFSGYQNIWPQEAVPHQGFCTAAVVLPFVRGLLGLEGDAVNKTILFAPHFPADWRTVSIKNYRVGRESFSFGYKREKGKVILKTSNTPNELYTLRFAPAIGIGSKIKGVVVNGESVPFRETLSSQTIQPVIEYQLKEKATAEVFFEPTVELIPPLIEAKTGEPNKGLKIISIQRSNKTLKVVVEGLANETYELRVVNENKIASISGAQQKGNILNIKMHAGKAGEFVRLEVVIIVNSK